MKKLNPKKILWIDLEMTGLDENHDRIIEVAALVTDWDFNVLAEFESGVGHGEGVIERLLDASEFYNANPKNKKLLLTLSQNSPAEREVEEALEAFIITHFGDEPVLLAGNSIHVDRLFIRQWWPKIEQKLHYRMLDVSSWKVVMAAKFGLNYHKKNAHRALDDIKESIEELKNYVKRLEK